MKRNRQGSISYLLARYYLAFTAALMLIFGGVYLCWNAYASALLLIPDVDGLTDSAAFRSGRYREVNAAKFLGASGGFAVLDESCRTVYSSVGTIPKIDDADTLSCIPEYDADTYINSVSFQTADGEQRLILTREAYSADGSDGADVMVLDSLGRVLEGGLIPGKTEFTQTEIGYLTGSWSKQYSLERYGATSGDGSPVTLLLLLEQYSESYYPDAMAKAGRLWLLVIPLYLVATLIFIILLNRRFRRPLDKLNTAIVRLGAGEKAAATDCGGPREIQQLGRSFDDMARKLAESEAETQKLERQRTTMLTDISHDLKTPITVISGYTNAIRDGKIPHDELPQYLGIISGKLDSLTELINSFHEYSRTEHPDFRLDLEEADLCEFLREYLADKFNEIDLAGFSLDVDFPNTPVLCKLDAFQLRRALDNIVNNSIRHNRLGTLIRVSLRECGGFTLLRIADNGRGIPEALRKDLFSPFTVGDRSRSKGGSGLGLAITKKIVEAHSWSIRLASDQSGARGTAFEIVIPK